MSVPSWVTQRLEISQAFVRGTRRAELPLPDLSTDEKLDLLAAVAVRKRFDFPHFPDTFAQDENVPITESVPSEEIRLALRRYFRADRLIDPPYSAVHRVFDRCRKGELNIHRFDYMQFKPLLSIDASLFDVSFRRWSMSHKTEVAGTSDAMNDENWLDFPNAQRCDYIAALHNESPERARHLLAQSLNQETASVRGKLLTALEPSVTVGDRAYLESLLADRAKSVQQILNRLLGGLAGTDQYKIRFEEATSRLSLKTSKILKKKSLVIDQPGGYKSHQLNEWYAETFNRIDPCALAAHLELSTLEFCELIENQGLAVECIAQLARQQLHEPMIMLASMHSGAFMHRLSFTDVHSLQFIDSKTKTDLWAALLGHASIANFTQWVSSLQSVYLALKMPIPPELGQQVIKRTEFKNGLKALVEEQTSSHLDSVEILVSILHVDCYAALYAKLDDIPSIYISPAKQLSNLINLLEDHYGS